MKQLLGMLPGVGSALKDVEVDDKQLDRLEGIVNSMTPDEREELKLLNKSRTKRIAKGAGSTPPDVNKLVKQFEMIQKMTKQMGSMGPMGRVKAAKEMARMDPNMMPGMKGMPGMNTKKSTRTAGVKSKFKQRKKRK